MILTIVVRVLLEIFLYIKQLLLQNGYVQRTLKRNYSTDLQRTYQNGQIIDAREGSLKTNLSKVLLMVMKSVKGFIKFIKGFGQKTKKVCNFCKWP